MNRPNLLTVKTLIVLAAVVGGIGAASLVLASSRGGAPATSDAPRDISSDCLACHSIKALKVTLPSGETLSLYVDPSVVSSSVHGGKLQCTDCHRDMAVYPHPPRQFDSLRSFALSQYGACERCHFDEYTKTLDSVHFAGPSGAGGGSPPVCTDCHGAHDIMSPAKPRSKISQTCSVCHEDVYNAYAKSVHGAAFVQDENPDVPVCTDCHRMHNIQDPLTAQFKVESVQLCSKCHSDKTIMAKYGISTLVTRTYLQSFHGMMVSLTKPASPLQDIPEPVCTDCHGIHDIQEVTAATSPVIKDNLAKTCQSCHPGAGPNFPTAWIGHYEPTLQKEPAVFLVRWFYRVMIPFVIGGLLVHILLDLWKTVTNK